MDEARKERAQDLFPEWEGRGWVGTESSLALQWR